jgi:hypothetical protein
MFKNAALKLLVFQYHVSLGVVAFLGGEKHVVREENYLDFKKYPREYRDMCYLYDALLILLVIAGFRDHWKWYLSILVCFSFYFCLNVLVAGIAQLSLIAKETYGEN